MPETACRLDDPRLEPLFAASGRMSLLFGMVEESSDHRFYNSGVYVEAGRVHHVHRKVYLATYGMFDEGRYLAAGEHLRAYDTRFGRCGTLICEDFWHPSAVSIVHADGADLVLGISSGPGRGVSGESQDLRSAQTWHNLNNLYARMYTSFRCLLQSRRLRGRRQLLGWFGGRSPGRHSARARAVLRRDARYG